MVVAVVGATAICLVYSYVIYRRVEGFKPDKSESSDG
jgi:hypothetical protein